MILGVIAGLLAAALLGAATLVHPAFAWLVCAPLLVFVRRRPGGGRRGLRASVVLGVVFAATFAAVVHVPWLTEAAQRYFELGRSAAFLGALALALGCGVVFGALLGLLLHGVGAVGVGWSAPALGAVWVTWEQLARIGFPSYPWVALAATQATTPTVLQTAGLLGQAGLAFVLAAGGAGFGHAAHEVTRRRAPTRPLVLVALLVTVVVGGGTLRLREAAPSGAPRCTLAGVDIDMRSGDLALRPTLGRYVAATERVATLEPDVVVWPESALQRDPRLDDGVASELRALAGRYGIVLVLGAPRTAWDSRWRQSRYNSLFALTPDGSLSTYDKRATVAIGERWPVPWIAAPAALRVAEVAAGAEPLLVRAGTCAVGTLVCSEAERPALARELAIAGADAIIVASNDAPLPRRAVALEVAQARLRAVETGLPVLRVANAGASLAIDRYGRTDERSRDAIVLAVVGPTDPAPATRTTVPFVVLCAIGAAATAMAGLRSRARRWPPGAG